MTDASLLARTWEYRVQKTALKLSARLRAALAAAREGNAAPRFARSRYGVLMRANWSDRTFQYCFYGTYGSALADLLNGMDRPFAFIDIGANQGLYSLIAAKAPQCRKVLALEPVRETFATLQDNIAANETTGRITAVEAALSDHAGTATISVNPAHSGTASLDHGAGATGAASRSVRLIDHEEFDDLVGEPADLVVKVDVEGHESVVINELMKSRHAPTIRHLFYEIDQRWTDNAAIVALLREAGFTTFRKYGVGRHYDMLASR